MKSKLLLLTTTSLIATSVATETLANPYPIVSRRSAEEKICFMHQNGISLDLSLLCGGYLDDAASSGIVGTGAFGTGAVGTSAVGAGASGRCDFSGQIAANGSRCGNRAASVRPGGRLGGRALTPSFGTRRTAGFGTGRSGAGA